MDIGEIVSDSIKYPLSDLKKVLILGFMFLISFLIVPIFLVMGYGFRALKASIAGAEELPEYDEWGEMFVDGLKVFVVQFVYFLIPALIIIIGSWASIAALAAASTTGTMTDPTAFIGIISGTVLIGGIVAIILGLIATIALANMAYNDSELGAAFRFGEIMNIISQIGWVDYIIWYVVIIIISMIIGIISGVIQIIPIIGTLVAILVIVPYAQLFFYRALALLYAYD
ncbi:MAG: DUF4013 domain-containing protein [Methanobacteriaceae archaeon]|nr:DUF4013 domain-containing protein [Methanobacteriaceae archaeon]MDP2836659.1 DUF4013 domain-containing protein [Methanobacteriaceae archaeon]MDP3036025.1 DUF4013 domain-containing protein [Methanobacteriaceae archaeon]